MEGSIVKSIVKYVVFVFVLCGVYVMWCLCYKVGPRRGVFCMAAWRSFHLTSGSVPMLTVPSAEPISKN